MSGQLSREEAYRLIRKAAGDALPEQGDSLVLSKKGNFNFLPLGLVPVKNVSSSYDIEGKDVLILADASTSGFSVNLPPCEYAEFRLLIVKKIDSSSNVVSVSADGSETIDGSSSYSLSSQWDSVILVSNGSSWYKVA